MSEQAATGRLAQISVSPGGVPKQAVPRAAVGPRGVEGDRQRDRRHHGGPTRAVCLYSLERITALQAEGHPIFPGAIGENLTIAGLDFAALGPGDRLAVGDSVVLEITSYTIPCTNLIPFFAGGEFIRVSQKVHPGWSRLYARVLQGGQLEAGQPVRVLPREEAATTPP